MYLSAGLLGVLGGFLLFTHLLNAVRQVFLQPTVMVSRPHWCNGGALPAHARMQSGYLFQQKGIQITAQLLDTLLATGNLFIQLDNLRVFLPPTHNIRV